MPSTHLFFVFLKKKPRHKHKRKSKEKVFNPCHCASAYVDPVDEPLLPRPQASLVKCGTFLDGLLGVVLLVVAQPPQPAPFLGVVLQVGAQRPQPASFF